MPHILQDILIILLPMIAFIDNRGITIMNHWPVTVGLFAGMIMGDIKSSLAIAGTFQLMSLGVAALGGSSVPEYALATTVAIYLKVRTGTEIGTAIAIGLPVGIMAINLDVLTRTLNSFVSEKSKKYLEEKKFKKMKLINLLSFFFVGMQAFIPMIILVIFGPSAVKNVINFIPKWFTEGLNLAGSMLPVVGIVMLIRYMPTSRYIWALIIGFVLAAYMNLPILAISLIGFSLGFYIYKDLSSKKLISNNENICNEGVDFDE